MIAEGACQVLTQKEEDSADIIIYGGTSNGWPTMDSVAARACANDGTPCMQSPCSPEPPTPFEVCVYATGDVPCPPAWTERSIYYEDGTDKRECTPCTCSSPTGGSCLIEIHVYTDNNCMNEQLSPNISSDMSAPCYDLISGLALGSKKAEVIDRVPGVCTPQGGDSTGKVEMEKPITFCCLT